MTVTVLEVQDASGDLKAKGGLEPMVVIWKFTSSLCKPRSWRNMYSHAS